MVTLYHWDLPQALDEDGGWLSREMASRFADFAGAVVGALGDRARRRERPLERRGVCAS